MILHEESVDAGVERINPSTRKETIARVIISDELEWSINDTCKR